MSRFNQIKHPKDNPELEALYNTALEAGFEGSEAGVPVNIVTSVSERPDLLGAMLGLVDGVVLKGLLPPTVKQMIAMSISIRNNCKYCSVLHTRALESMGVSEEVIRSCASDPDMSDVPPPQRAILQFAVKASQDPLSVTDEEIEGLREQGMSEGEIMEAAMMAATENFLNTWSRVSRIPVDGETHF